MFAEKGLGTFSGAFIVDNEADNGNKAEDANANGVPRAHAG